MKTKEELTQLKTEYETLNNKLKELSDEELEMVTGGENLNLDPVPDINDIGAGIPAGNLTDPRINPKAIATRVMPKVVCGSIDKAAIKK